MSRVAIVGSCITRDLWRFRGETGPELFYISRTSFPSLFATPIPDFTPPTKLPLALKRQPRRALIADLDKTALAELVAWRPTHLIFDFIDERFDLLSVGGTLITDSWELQASGYLDHPAFRAARAVPRLSAACERLWLDAALELAALIRATPLSQCTLILHSAQWATRRLTDTGAEAPVTDVAIKTGRPADIGAHNALLARYETAFSALLPAINRVEAPDLRVADPSHQWGLSPFHYTPDYYAEISRQLDALGVRTAVAA